MRAHQEVHILDAHLALRFAAPRDVVRGRRVPGVRGIPVLARVQVPLHVPGTRRVVDVILGGGGAEGRTRVQMVRAAVHGHIKVMTLDELDEIRAAHVLAPLAERVVQIELVDAQLVGDRGVAVVRHTAGDPMMAADRLHIPDLVGVADRDAVRLVRAVPFQQTAEPDHTLARGRHIRQHQRDDILLADAARPLRHVIGIARLPLRRTQLNQRIGRKHTLVDGNCFGGAHRHVMHVHAGLGQHTAVRQHIRRDRVPARIVRQIDLDMAEHRTVTARLVLGTDHNEPFRIVTARPRVVIARDNRRPVVAGRFSNQYRGTRHRMPL